MDHILISGKAQADILTNFGENYTNFPAGGTDLCKWANLFPPLIFQLVLKNNSARSLQITKKAAQK